MHLIHSAIRWISRRVFGTSATAGRAILNLVRRRRAARARRLRGERTVLPSLYERHPSAQRAPRRPVGLRTVDLDRIVGTARKPSQNTADFLPLPHLRGQNWRSRWQRINRALDGLSVLPPVELVQVGDEYYVVDGHNRVAAARLAGGVGIDADVTQLLIPGVAPQGGAVLDGTSLIGTDVVRQAGRGRYSRTVEQRSSGETVSRQDLLRADEDGA